MLCVIKRVQHPRNVFQWRTFDAALAQGTDGITFEIGEHEILAGVEGLSKMEVAVDTDPHCVDAAVSKISQLLCDSWLALQHCLRVLSDCLWQQVQARAQCVAGPAQTRQHAVIKTVPVEIGEW